MVFIYFCIFMFLVVAWGILVPRRGWNPHPLQWKHGALTTGTPEKSPKMVFRHWTSDSTEQCDFWERRNKVSPISTPFYCLESFHTALQRRGTLVESHSLSELRRWSWGCGRTRQLEFSGQHTREEIAAQKECSEDLQSSSLLFSWLLIRGYIWGTIWSGNCKKKSFL